MRNAWYLATVIGVLIGSIGCWPAVQSPADGQPSTVSSPVGASGESNEPGQTAGTNSDPDTNSAAATAGDSSTEPVKAVVGDGTSAAQTKTPAGNAHANVPAGQANSGSSRKADGPAKDISFDDLNLGMPKDCMFRPIMLTYNDGLAKSLLGKRIRVAGYMNATDSLRGIDEFILLKNLECKFGPGGQADHLVHVVMQDGVTADFTDRVVYVEGVIELKPFPVEGPSTWSIYDLKATSVSTRKR